MDCLLLGDVNLRHTVEEEYIKFEWRAALL
jgi:hypothetical protein